MATIKPFQLLNWRTGDYVITYIDRAGKKMGVVSRKLMHAKSVAQELRAEHGAKTVRIRQAEKHLGFTVFTPVRIS